MTPAGLANFLTRNDRPELRYLVPRHIAYLSTRLTMAVLGFAKRRLIVSCPPRHGKSEQISNWLPTWFLNNRPHGRVMLGAYNTDFAKQWGRKVRNNIETYGSELNVRMSGDSTGVEHWHTSAGGGMMARGLGGAFTGFGGDLLICDDPIKSAAEANSAAYREAVSDWWRSAFMTRVEPNATVVLTMTRWHTDDLVGRILSDPEQAQQWDVITLPAIADEQGDLLGRKAGEALWPERKSAADLAQEKISVGDYVWKALYQQVPPNLNGGTVYYSFKHGVNPIGSLDPTLDVVSDVPLDLSIDFNRQPGSHAVIGQFHKATGTAVALEELMTPAGVAKHIALAFVKWWQTKKPRVPYVNLYGDASGGAGVMTDGKTAWNTVETELRTAGILFKTRVGARNPGVHDRVEAVNTALFDAAGERHYLIHPRCMRLIRDFQKVIWDGDDLNKRGNVELTHISDADGYRIASILPVRRTRFHTISASTL